MTEKMQAIDQMSRLRNMSELRSFLGIINYYGRFINNRSSILAPLYILLQKDVLFKWARSCEWAFLIAKKHFCIETVLAQ